MSLELSSPEVEKSILSLMLQSTEETNYTVRILGEGIANEHFGNPEFAKLFDYIAGKFRGGEFTDLISTSSDNQSQRLFNLDASTLAEIATFQFTAAYISRHIEILRKYHARRIAIKASQAIENAIIDGIDEKELSKIVSKASEGVVTALSSKSGVQTSSEATKRFLERFEENRKSGEIAGIPTGIREIDEITGGMRKGELWIIGGKTSGGKSVLALQIVENATSKALCNKGLVYTLEMESDEIIARMISCSQGADMSEIMNPRTITKGTLEKMKRGVNDIHSRSLLINDQSGLTIDEIEACAIQHNDAIGIDIIVVDYVQLITGGNERSRADEIAMYSRRLKQLAKKLQCVVISPSQLNDDGRLRESRAIGHDANFVCTIEDGDGIQIHKNRSGKKGMKLPLVLDGSTQQFITKYTH